jgi:two-component system, chemotaxis family, chemotaxis protein CheY
MVRECLSSYQTWRSVVKMAPLDVDYTDYPIPVRSANYQTAGRGAAVNPRILVVDDSKTTRRVLSAMVSSRWTVCGEADCGTSAVKKFRELKPDIVVLDLAMPDIDGIEVGRQIHAIDPAAPIVLFTLLDPWGLEGPARNAGIQFVIPKTDAWRLIEAIEKISTTLKRPHATNRLKPASKPAKSKPRKSIAQRPE